MCLSMCLNHHNHIPQPHITTATATTMPSTFHVPRSTTHTSHLTPHNSQLTTHNSQITGHRSTINDHISKLHITTATAYHNRIRISQPQPQPQPQITAATTTATTRIQSKDAPFSFATMPLRREQHPPHFGGSNHALCSVGGPTQHFSK